MFMTDVVILSYFIFSFNLCVRVLHTNSSVSEIGEENSIYCAVLNCVVLQCILMHILAILFLHCIVLC